MTSVNSSAVSRDMDGIQTTAAAAAAAGLFVGVMRRSSEDAWVCFTDVDQNGSDWVHCSVNWQ
jgi:hypothetical protein